MRDVKESKIDIIGDISRNWDVIRLKYLCDIQTGDSDTQDANPDGEYPFYVRSPIVERSTNYTFDGEGILMAGDGAGAGRIFHHAYGKYAVHQRVYRLSNFKKIDSTLLFYYLQNLFCKQMDKGSAQSTVPSVRLPMLLNFNVCLPPIDEQERIVNFLDEKCEQIDSLTADIQSQIDTLEEYKKSVITEAVTKGLNPDVEMKDSGIEWIGLIPRYWKSSRLGYESYIRARLGWKGLKADEYVDEGYAFISAFNIQNNQLVWTPLNFITKQRYDESPEIKLRVGDILIVKDGAGIGKTARIDALPNGETAPNSSLCVITPISKLDYRYCSYYLQSSIFNNYVLRLINGMGVPHLTQEVLRKINILLPPVEEQQEISDYLDAKCSEIDAIISEKKEQLSTLEEYKKSLIYEYVTGKKEVAEA